MILLFFSMIGDLLHTLLLLNVLTAVCLLENIKYSTLVDNLYTNTHKKRDAMLDDGKTLVEAGESKPLKKTRLREKACDKKQ